MDLECFGIALIKSGWNLHVDSPCCEGDRGFAFGGADGDGHPEFAAVGDDFGEAVLRDALPDFVATVAADFHLDIDVGVTEIEVFQSGEMKTEDDSLRPFAAVAGDGGVANAAWADDVEYGRIFIIHHHKINRRVPAGFYGKSWLIGCLAASCDEYGKQDAKECDA